MVYAVTGTNSITGVSKISKSVILLLITFTSNSAVVKSLARTRMVAFVRLTFLK